MIFLDNCDWTNPGLDSFRNGGGNLGDAIYRLPIDIEDKRKLTTLVEKKDYVEMATITQKGIEGFYYKYDNLRYMAFGRNKICRNVKMNWEPARVERGLVYCTPKVCVIIPTVCNNISLIDRHQRTEFKIPDPIPEERSQEKEILVLTNKVPEPGSMFLLGIALAALIFTRAKFKR